MQQTIARNTSRLATAGKDSMACVSHQEEIYFDDDEEYIPRPSREYDDDQPRLSLSERPKSSIKSNNNKLKSLLFRKAMMNKGDRKSKTMVPRAPNTR
mmetsp:Transcript_12215/g.37257  ORF Transcript_12215/g.37257 Transcript_12215/m.37257 type:complete len:98 (+) Transcript_12215:91-384(+)